MNASARVLFAPRFPLNVRRFAGRWEPFAFADLALLMFFVFLIHASFIVQPGVRLTLPAAPFSDGLPYQAAVITLTQEGLVFFDDQRTTLEGLRQTFAQLRHDRPDVALIIEADEGVPHGRLIETFNMAMEAGLREVLLATRLAEAPAP